VRSRRRTKDEGRRLARGARSGRDSEAGHQRWFAVRFLTGAERQPSPPGGGGFGMTLEPP
jgi:hypothetical protein